MELQRANRISKITSDFGMDVINIILVIVTIKRWNAWMQLLYKYFITVASIFNESMKELRKT